MSPRTRGSRIHWLIWLVLHPPHCTPPAPRLALSPPAWASLPSGLCPQPGGVCCRAPGHLPVRGELREPGQRPAGEAAGLPGGDDGREQRQPHELHGEPAGAWPGRPSPRPVLTASRGWAWLWGPLLLRAGKQRYGLWEPDRHGSEARRCHLPAPRPEASHFTCLCLSFLT